MDVELLALGGVVFFFGVIVANIAIVQMSRRINALSKGNSAFRWWNSIGQGSSLVIYSYRQIFPGKKDELEKRLRAGYWMAGLGLVIMLGISLLHSAKRGSF